MLDGTRLDGTYSCTWSKPFVTVVGKVPEFIVGLYQAFLAEYPAIGPDVFAGLDGSRLNRVGVTANFLEGRVLLELSVEKLEIEVSRIRHESELKFVRDCIRIAMDYAVKWQAVAGFSTYRLATWSGIGDKDPRVLLGKRMPQIPDLAADSFGASTLLALPRIEIGHPAKGWRMTGIAEPSAAAANQLFILLNYEFDRTSAFESVAAQIELIDRTREAFFNWLRSEK